ncbi:MAG: hypothetical protein CL908_13695 [Deltaproteobacteria bacterium]|jgi:hypothetical protein|nr:hypothetical protein [Deltaproteobacteria bacterium]
MRWLTGSTLEIESTLPVEAAREAIRRSTAGTSSDDADAESCVSKTVGRVVILWRTTWRNSAFVPGPVFRGRLRRAGDGSLLSGRFTLPFFSLAAVVSCACFAVLLGLSLAIDLPSEPATRAVFIGSWLFFCVPLLLFARWMLRLPWTYGDRDEAFVERHLRRALEAPAE